MHNINEWNLLTPRGAPRFRVVLFLLITLRAVVVEIMSRAFRTCWFGRRKKYLALAFAAAFAFAVTAGAAKNINKKNKKSGIPALNPVQIAPLIRPKACGLPVGLSQIGI